jgi:undecaprenyl diphosphate synthase
VPTGSSTQAVPEDGRRLKHLAVIMDGNGRWAKKRMLPRVAGHKKGLEAVRSMVGACIEREIGYLTLFAFSSENWRRPADEVSFLMGLFVRALEREVRELHEHGVRLRVVGDIPGFSEPLRAAISAAEALTASNARLHLTICANYGGRWDILQACNRLSIEHPERAGHWSEADLAPYLSMNFAPEPDLFIRTGGEQRVSNFLLWQLAYTELYFTDILWPDFHATQLDEAIHWYRQRERRFGRISEQLDVPAGRGV